MPRRPTAPYRHTGLLPHIASRPVGDRSAWHFMVATVPHGIPVRPRKCTALRIELSAPQALGLMVGPGSGMDLRASLALPWER